MNNVISSRNRLLLTLTTLGIGVSPSYKQVFSFFPWGYKRRNFYALIFRTEKDGLVRRIQTKTDNLIKITPAGLLAVKGSDLAERSDPSALWDGKWRMVIYEMTEKDRYLRDKLRGILVNFGFAMLMRSAYISPFDTVDSLKTKLAEENLLDRVMIFTIASDQLGDARELARRIYGLDQLKDSYLGMLRRLQFVRGQQLPDKRSRGLKRLKSDFIQLVASDPNLPAQLLPKDWPLLQVTAAMTKD